MVSRDILKVLVVDDEPAIRELIGKVFIQKGQEVAYAGDGELAVEMSLQGGIDLIVMDIDMYPGMDGVSALALLKSNVATRSLPVVLLTNDSHAKTLTKCRELGAFGFILKSDLNLQKLMLSAEAIIKSVVSVADRLEELPFACEATI